MSNDLNRVILIGRLTNDPELRQTQSGTSVCKFSIANNRTYKQNDEKKKEVSFFNIVAWGKSGEIISEYMRKGSMIGIDGRLKQERWENQEGKKQSSVSVVVDNFEFLDSKKPESTESIGEPSPETPPIPLGTDDDDIPF